MTLEETKKFLHIIGLYFPNAFKGVSTKEDKDIVAGMWQNSFKDNTPQQMLSVLKSYLESEVEIATPSLGKLFSDLKQMLSEQEGLPGWYLETEQTPPDKQLLLEIEQIKENLRNGK